MRKIVCDFPILGVNILSKVEAKESQYANSS